MKIKRLRNLICLSIAIIFSLSASRAYPYDAKEGGHIGISRKSIEIKVKLHRGRQPLSGVRGI